MAGGGRLAFTEWPALAEQIETGDFVADVVAHRPRARMGAGVVAARRAASGRSRFYRAHVAS